MEMHLNYLPLRFTAEVFNGGVVSFEGKKHQELAAQRSALSVKTRALRQRPSQNAFFLCLRQ